VYDVGRRGYRSSLALLPACPPASLMHAQICVMDANAADSHIKAETKWKLLDFCETSGADLKFRMSC